ncbi:sensor histidine kinase [Novosphingobium rosa]|uniref:sensor histidine kinase n=1 Tax=Novosphingobium rosa TaxID=76978 RepID=UPI00083463D9|nr:sensor histidine kinase [Novosphingobium rosa]
MISGHCLIWYVVFAPRYSFALASAKEAVAIVVTMLSELLVLWVIAYYQNAIEKADVARTKLDAERQLVVQELNHRVKNTLAVAGGIARQTFREAPAQIKADFQGRLAALSHAHELIAKRQDDRVNIDGLLQTCLAPYCPPGQSRIRMAGPRLALSPALAVNLALGINELATSATKYGALSVDGGLVRITWSLTNDSMLSLTWVERGGPTVTPPSRKGFGTKLIQTGLHAQPDGKVDISFEPAGVVCTITTPL